MHVICRLNMTTAPDAPTNLSITVEDGEVATANWDPPAVSQHSAFKLKLIPLNILQNIVINETTNTLRDLTPGATYQVQVSSIYEDKESQNYISTNFTTKPNPPGRLIVWFRNETTLIPLWEPPVPAGFFTDYKICIDPKDANCTYVKRGEDDTPIPAQVAFNGLVPGRKYNISVQTVSEDRLSEPSLSTGQYRTKPLRPHNVTFNPDKIGPYNFEVQWEGPEGVSEFDMYTVAIDAIDINGTTNTIATIERGQPMVAQFTENLCPGMTYMVLVKSHSDGVDSHPATGYVTTRPLPVTKLQQAMDDITGETSLTWEPNPDSSQDTYKVEYHDVDIVDGDSNSAIVDMTAFSMSNLKPGNNYSITVKAISNGMESEGTTLIQAARPSSPTIE